MIDLSLAPYNMVGNWTGSDASATDWSTCLQAACDAAGMSNGVDPTNGGVYGDTLVLPKGAFMLSKTLVIPPGVALIGSGDRATNLIMKSGFDPAKPLVDIGNMMLQTPAFGSRLARMAIHARKEDTSNQTAALVYTNNAQDTDPILDNVTLMGWSRRSFHGEKGWGGASIISLRQVNYMTVKPSFGMMLNYGEGSLINVDGLEGGSVKNPANPSYPVPGSYGLGFFGGVGRFRRLHFEMVETGICVDMSGGARSLADFNFVTGGPLVGNLFEIGNRSTQLGRIRLKNVERNGCYGHTVYNGQPGASPIDTNIFNEVVL